ncbi:MAG: hypothetical protein WDZ41_05360 [Candidatus Babeliales bacterium]
MKIKHIATILAFNCLSFAALVAQHTEERINKAENEQNALHQAEAFVLQKLNEIELNARIKQQVYKKQLFYGHPLDKTDIEILIRNITQLENTNPRTACDKPTKELTKSEFSEIFQIIKQTACNVQHDKGRYFLPYEHEKERWKQIIRRFFNRTRAIIRSFGQSRYN